MNSNGDTLGMISNANKDVCAEEFEYLDLSQLLTSESEKAVFGDHMVHDMMNLDWLDVPMNSGSDIDVINGCNESYGVKRDFEGIPCGNYVDYDETENTFFTLFDYDKYMTTDGKEWNRAAPIINDLRQFQLASPIAQMSQCRSSYDHDECTDDTADETRLHAGSSRQISLSMLGKMGFFRVGDKFTYSRTFAHSSLGFKHRLSDCMEQNRSSEKRRKLSVEHCATVIGIQDDGSVSLELENGLTIMGMNQPSKFENAALDHAGFPKTNRPNGNGNVLSDRKSHNVLAWKSISVTRNGQQMGRLFDIRYKCFNSTSFSQ